MAVGVLVNIPIAAAALVVVARVLNIPHTRREHRIDWPGAVALTVGAVSLLVVAEQGRDWGWSSVAAVACYGIAAVGLIGFVLAERWIGDEVLLPLRLFRNSVFSVTSAGGLIIGTGMFGGLILIPQYLQIVKGASPTKTGLLLPLMSGIMLASVVSGQLISRTSRYKIFPVLGTALMALALLLLVLHLGVDTSLLEVDVYMALFGIGLGGCLQTLIMAVQNAVPAVTWAWPPHRPHSSGRWAAPWASRCSCRSCSPPREARSPTRSAPSCLHRNFNLHSLTRRSAPTLPTMSSWRLSGPVEP
jgi:hypothetical protein